MKEVIFIFLWLTFAAAFSYNMWPEFYNSLFNKLKRRKPKKGPVEKYPRKRYPRPGISRNLITHSQKNPFR